MNNKECVLLEAIHNLLSDKVKLGLSYHGDKEERSHKAQFRHQEIEDMFRIKANIPDMNLYDTVCGAFYHTHSYRNIDDPDFDIAFKKQMGKIVPPSDQAIAFDVLDNIRKEFCDNDKGGDIADMNVTGPNLNELR